MATALTDEAVRAEDVVSVGSRVSWPAIFAGAILALALHFLLALLGAAVGVSVSDRVDSANLATGALVWTIAIICGSLFIGGMVTSQLTVRENKVEAVLYGILMWALLMGFLLALGAAGVSAGFNAMVGLRNAGSAQADNVWEQAALNAGIPQDQVKEWKSKLTANVEKAQADGKTTRAEVSSAATRVTWYAFAGGWLSMLAAAAGSWIGAGPTFRVVSAVTNTGRARVIT